MWYLTKTFVCIIDPDYGDQAYCMEKAKYDRQNKFDKKRNIIMVTINNAKIINYHNRGYIKKTTNIFPMFEDDLSWIDKLYKY